MKPRSNWRKYFLDHPGLACKAQEAFVGGKPKIWCKKCFQWVLDHYSAGISSISQLWDDEELHKQLKAEGRSWISSRTSSCCFHLSACINQPLEVRKEAGRVHQEDNKRRAMRQAEKRQKARHSPVSFQLLAGGGTSDVDFILAFGDPFVPDADVNDMLAQRFDLKHGQPVLSNNADRSVVTSFPHTVFEWTQRPSDF